MLKCIPLWERAGSGRRSDDGGLKGNTNSKTVINLN
ncbi:hypothetical protein J2Y56_001474 [Pseudomonas sp. BE134]|jgi:hypothetical protein|nr:hypothetical protein [Pseudomonas sp. BE134]